MSRMPSRLRVCALLFCIIAAEDASIIEGLVISECDFHQDMCGWEHVNSLLPWRYERPSGVGLRLDTLRSQHHAQPSGIRSGELEYEGSACLSLVFHSDAVYNISLAVDTLNDTGVSHRVGTLRPAAGEVQLVTVSMSKDTRLILQVPSRLSCNDSLHLNKLKVESGPCRAKPTLIIGDYETDARCSVLNESVEIEYLDVDVIPTTPETTTPQTTTSLRPTRPANLNLTANCTFERDLCGYAISGRSLYKWERKNKGNGLNTTGPRGDHTTGTGYFMNAPGPGIGTVTVMTSEFLAPSQNTSVCFFYHMYGAGVGTLKVGVLEDDTSAASSVWSKSGNQGDQWLRGCFVSNTKSSYQIAFESYKKLSFGSKDADVAIDDITFELSGSATQLFRTSSLY